MRGKVEKGVGPGLGLVVVGGLGLLWLLSAGNSAQALQVDEQGNLTAPDGSGGGGGGFMDMLANVGKALGMGVATKAISAGGTAAGAYLQSLFTGGGAAAGSSTIGVIGSQAITYSDLAANPELAYALAQGPDAGTSGAAAGSVQTPPSPVGPGDVVQVAQSIMAAPGSEVVGVVGTQPITASELAESPELAYAIAQGPSGSSPSVGVIGGHEVTASELAQNPELAYAIAQEAGSTVAGQIGSQVITYADLAANPELAYALAQGAAAAGASSVVGTVGGTAITAEALAASPELAFAIAAEGATAAGGATAGTATVSSVVGSALQTVQGALSAIAPYMGPLAVGMMFAYIIYDAMQDKGLESKRTVQYHAQVLLQKWGTPSRAWAAFKAGDEAAGYEYLAMRDLEDSGFITPGGGFQPEGNMYAGTPWEALAWEFSAWEGGYGGQGLGAPYFAPLLDAMRALPGEPTSAGQLNAAALPAYLALPPTHGQTSGGEEVIPTPWARRGAVPSASGSGPTSEVAQVVGGFMLSPAGGSDSK